MGIFGNRNRATLSETYEKTAKNNRYSLTDIVRNSDAVNKKELILKYGKKEAVIYWKLTTATVICGIVVALVFEQPLLWRLIPFVLWVLFGVFTVSSLRKLKKKLSGEINKGN